MRPGPAAELTRTSDESFHPTDTNRSKTRRRSLTSDLATSSCPGLDDRPKPQLPSIPRLLRTSTYAASFSDPAYRAITKDLVEGVTGMLVGDAGVSPSLERMKVQKMDRTGFARGQEEVIVLRTSFPHEPLGRLSAWDDFLPRAFVVLRDPLDSVARYFDQLYETRGHLPTGSVADADDAGGDTVAAAWIRWRDGEFSDQIRFYGKFVTFWMEKYLGRDADRVFFAYEDLTDEGRGPGEAVRLARFLADGVKANAAEVLEQRGEDGTGSGGPAAGGEAEFVAEALGSFADVAEVPCVWKEILGGATSEGRAANPPTNPKGAHPEGEFVFRGEGSTAERPLTPENLEETSGMLSELMDRWSSHGRLVSILSGYLEEVDRRRGIL